VDLFWPGSGNPRAIGATLKLIGQQQMYYRDVRSASGYISGDPARIHFGIAADEQLESLAVRWPDGNISTISTPPTGALIRVIRE
jgi:hypothetical protein